MGVRAGTLFTVFSGDDPPQPIGEIKVTGVRADGATAEIVTRSVSLKEQLRVQEK